jgi:hypothetical protein
MSSRHHNKKRNTGVVYELLLRRVSSHLVEGDKKKAQVCLDIISRHFRPGTELYREFRLFNALANSNVSGSPVAAVIITEAKDAARRANRDQLEFEKGRLIAEINRKLGGDFYDTHFDRYKDYATIQTLLNDWRTFSPPIERVISYETRLVESMMAIKHEIQQPQPESRPEVNTLVVNIMTEKLNSKFSSVMTEEQRAIVRDYIFSPPGSDQTSLRESMGRVKHKAIQDLSDYLSRERNEYITERAGEVKRKLEELSFDVIDDDAVVRFLTASKLSQEIREGDV